MELFFRPPNKEQQNIDIERDAALHTGLESESGDCSCTHNITTQSIILSIVSVPTWGMDTWPCVLVPDVITGFSGYRWMQDGASISVAYRWVQHWTMRSPSITRAVRGWAQSLPHPHSPPPQACLVWIIGRVTIPTQITPMCPSAKCPQSQSQCQVFSCRILVSKLQSLK